MRRITVLITTLAFSLSGLTSSPANAAVPSDGTYLCTTGVASSSTPNFTITNGVVYDGDFCVGEVVIPEGVTSIGISAFSGSALTEISIPSTVTGIANFAFSRITSMTSITIPENVVTIGRLAFDGAFLLDSITVDGANANYTSIEGVLFNKAATTLISYPVGKSASEYAIPSSVTTIGDCAFYGAHQLTGVTIPSSVITIGEYAFYDAASLTSVTIPLGVTSIGKNTFSLATALTSVTIPPSVTSIGNSAFMFATALISVTIPASVNIIGDGAFYGAVSLTSITIPASVNIIGDYAFLSASSLTSITVDTSNANYRSIEGVLFNKRTTSLITYPAAKSGTEYSIPTSVTSIENSAFQNARSLTSITIPASVTNIGDDHPFYGASSLTSITVDSSNANYSSTAGVLFNKRTTSLITYPAAKSGTGYSIPASVTSIGNNAFVNARSLTSITIPPSVTSIGNSAFMFATALISVTIPASVTSIGDYAFLGAISLINVNFQGDAPSFGEDPFDRDATVAKAHIKLGATGFSQAGSLWCGLTVAIVDQKATSKVKPKIVGSAKVSKTLTASKGTWIGSPSPTFKYQWYSCTKPVSVATATIPKSCKKISKATKTSLKLTKTYKGKYIAVAVSGKGARTSATIWLSKSTAQVK